MKANKDTVTVANAGIGAASNLCGMMPMSALQTRFTTVPYKGAGPAMTDLMGSQFDVMCDQTTNASSRFRAAQLRL